MAGHAFACSLCDQCAGEVRLFGPATAAVIERDSFTSRLEGRVAEAQFDRLRSALSSGDAKALFQTDLEYAPFYCPKCDQSFCGAHWQKWNVFDEDGWHDSIRGACPNGHKRMLED